MGRASFADRSASSAVAVPSVTGATSGPAFGPASDPISGPASGPAPGPAFGALPPAGSSAKFVRRRVCEPAGMHDTELLRSDELPGNAALGYLADDGPWTKVFHLSVRGNGDGGIYSTAADLSSLWSARFAGRSCRGTG